MSLGNKDNNKDSRYQPTYYSAYTGFNTGSTVDPSRISYSFWNRMLKITITPVAGRNDDGTVRWDKDNSISAHLTHTKAHILAQTIKAFLEDPVTYNSSGIISNETLVTISNGEEFNTPGYYLVMRKINKETGETLSSYTYHFNTGFHSSVKNYNEKTAEFSLYSDPFDTLEIVQFMKLLESYEEAMTGANAYAVVEAITSDRMFRNTFDNIEACAKALGVAKNFGGGSSNSSVFNNRNNRAPVGGSNRPQSDSGAHMTPDEIEDRLFG